MYHFREKLAIYALLVYVSRLIFSRKQAMQGLGSFFSKFSRAAFSLFVLLSLPACYKVPMEQIEQSHQYSARQLIDEWRNYSARKPLPLSDNDDYYAPYTPSVRSQNNSGAYSSSGGYYYDPRVDNPQAYQPPHISNIRPEREVSPLDGNVITNDLLYAY